MTYKQILLCWLNNLTVHVLFTSSISTWRISLHSSIIRPFSALFALLLTKFKATKTYQWLLGFTKNDLTYMDTLQEIFGLCLTPTLLITKAFFIYGIPNTGKSTLLRLLALMVGFENIDGINLDNFTEQTYLEKLEYILLNLSYDNSEGLSSQFLNQAWVLLKRSISGEMFSINPKYKDTHLLNPTAKHFFAINKLPKFQPNDSFFKRILVLPAENIMEGDINKINRDFYLHFTDDRVLLLNWALTGYKDC